MKKPFIIPAILITFMLSACGSGTKPEQTSGTSASAVSSAGDASGIENSAAAEEVTTGSTTTTSAAITLYYWDAWEEKFDFGEGQVFTFTEES